MWPPQRCDPARGRPTSGTFVRPDLLCGAIQRLHRLLEDAVRAGHSAFLAVPSGECGADNVGHRRRRLVAANPVPDTRLVESGRPGLTAPAR